MKKKNNTYSYLFFIGLCFSGTVLALPPVTSNDMMLVELEELNYQTQPLYRFGIAAPNFHTLDAITEQYRCIFPATKKIVENFFARLRPTVKKNPLLCALQENLMSAAQMLTLYAPLSCIQDAAYEYNNHIIEYFSDHCATFGPLVKILAAHRCVDQINDLLLSAVDAELIEAIDTLCSVIQQAPADALKGIEFPLMYAYRHAKISALKQMLDCNVHPDTDRDGNGNTLLHCVVIDTFSCEQKGHIKRYCPAENKNIGLYGITLIETLLMHHADPEIKNDAGFSITQTNSLLRPSPRKQGRIEKGTWARKGEKRHLKKWQQYTDLFEKHCPEIAEKERLELSQAMHKAQRRAQVRELQKERREISIAQARALF